MAEGGLPLRRSPGPCHSRIMAQTEQQALEAYSRGEMTALELRHRLGGASYGEVLRLIANERGALLCEETAVLKRVVVRDREPVAAAKKCTVARFWYAPNRWAALRPRPFPVEAGPAFAL